MPTTLVATRDIPLSAEEFRLLRDFVHETTGIYLDETRMFVVQSRLAPRVISRHLRSFEDYYYFLKYDQNRMEEFARVADVLATHETYFFREHAQVTALMEKILPELFPSLPRRPTGRPIVRIWSAGCSTGEEPYSIAMALDQHGWLARLDAEILANDLSERVILHARRAVYRGSSFRVTPEGMLERYFRPGKGEEHEFSEALRKHVAFRTMNLIDGAAMGEVRGIDVIYCRNVLIYFDDAMRKATVRRFLDALRPGGWLFLGHSESLFRISNDFKPVQFEGAIGYRKP